MTTNKPASRILAWILAFAMIFATAPVSVFAQDDQSLGESGETLSQSDTALGQSGGLITAFDELPDDIRYQRTSSPVLPEKLGGTVDGNTAEIPVTWAAEDYPGPGTATGLFVFFAEPGEGYILGEGVERPKITLALLPMIGAAMAGNGTSGSPLQITNAHQLAGIADLVNQGMLESFWFGDSTREIYLKLMKDIDLSGYGKSYNGGAGWSPIGDYTNHFKGNFDGGGNKITGLYIDDTTRYYAGLFGVIDGGTVQNLGLVNVDITGGHFVGGVAGLVYGGTVQNCYSTGAVRGTGGFVGGVAGVAGNASTVQNCYSTGAVSGNDSVGGVAGELVSGGTVQNCYSTGAVRGTDDFVGGVVGVVEGGTVKNCYSTGAVSGIKQVGGVAGYVNGTNAKVENCAALGPSVSGSSDVGRVVGLNYNSSGTLSGNRAFSGIPGTWNNTGADNLDGADMTAANVADAGFWTGTLSWDGTDVWDIATGKLPILANLAGQDDTIPAHLMNAPYFPGDGDSTNPFEISTEAQLAKLADIINNDNSNPTYNGIGVFYKLTNDLDLSGYNAANTAFNSGKGWIPIGHKNAGSLYFKGNFDGDGKTITGLYINKPSTDSPYDNTGLFGRIDGGTVKNLGLVNVNITGGNYTGGVAGYVSGGTVQNCYTTGAVRGNEYVGGVAGVVSNGTVQNCYSTGAVVGNNPVGGVAGIVYGTNAKAQNCYSSGAVKGSARVGGVVGTVYGTVQNCYSTGAVSGTGNQIGGVAGFVIEGTVQNCYSTGAVSGINQVGGVAGYVSGTNLKVENCAALGPTVSGSTNVGRVVGLNDNNTGTLLGNYAFSGMTGGGSLKTHNGLDGADMTDTDVATAAFWTTTMSWSTSVWTIAPDKLPILEGLSGQDGMIPAHLAGGVSPYFHGEGTSAIPFEISTAAQLEKLADIINNDNGNTTYNGIGVFYELQNDIDLSGYGEGAAFNSGMGWEPIGHNSNNMFKGNFDGGGNKITGLYINHTGYNNTGLFGWIDGGTVENLGLVNVNITGGNFVGGVAGYVRGTNAKVQNCYSTGAVVGNNQVGGVAGGVTDGTVQNCYSTGAVEGSGNYVGGVAGQVTGTVQNCYSTGAVVGTDSVGGVAGNVYNTNAKVQNCAALNPSVTATTGTGVGRVVGEFASSNMLSGNYAFSGIPGTWSNKGAADLDGADMSATNVATATFWTGTMSWDGTDVWDINTDGKLPVLANLAGQDGTIPVHISGTWFAGEGTSAIPFLISTAAQLEKLAELVNSATESAKYNTNLTYYKLTSDIDLSAYGEGAAFNSGKGWVPIGHDDNYTFKGNFDGGGYKITGLYINNTGYNNTGLFGAIEGGTVQNLGVVNVDITGINRVGGVAGRVNDNSTVQNCYSTGAVEGSGSVGGVAGYVDGTNAKVQNCYSTGAVEGSGSVGGVAGTVIGTNAKVENCYFTGAVEGTGNYVGGVAGAVNYSSSVENCYATGTVEGSNYVGGVAGTVYGMNAKVQNCYSTGAVSGTDNVGGVAGWVTGTNAKVQNCYSTGAVSGTGNYVGGVAGTVDDSSVQNCAALAPTVSGSTNVGRVAGFNNGTLSGNRAFSGMTGHTWSNKGAADLDGADMTAPNAHTPAFWTTTMSWSTSVWDIETGKLPVLKNVGGNQDGGSGLYLTAKRIENTTITLSPSSYVYDGTAKTPGVTVKLGSVTLVENTDYEIDSYGNNTNAGTATVTVTGIGNYSGTKTANFTVSKKALADSMIAAIADQPYTGSPLTPALTVTDTAAIAATDYTVSYTNNTAIGTATATITATAAGNYSGSASKTFRIVKGSAPTATTPANIMVKAGISGSFDLGSIMLSKTGVGARSYALGAFADSDSILTGTPALSGSSVSFTGASGAAVGDTATLAVTVTTTNYEDCTVTLTFEVTDLALVTLSGVSVADKTYDGDPASYAGALTAIDDAGSSVSAGSLTATYTWSGTPNVGTFITGTTPPTEAGDYLLTVTATGAGMIVNPLNIPFTISKRTVTVTGVSQRVKVGTAPAAFTAAIAGEVAGHGLTNRVTTASCPTYVDAVGTYPIIPGLSGDSTGNYVIEYINGTLTVTELWTFAITATAGANGSISPSGEIWVNEGASQTFTITANSGYHVSRVLVDGVNKGAIGSYTFENVIGDHTISVTFAADSTGGGSDGGSDGGSSTRDGLSGWISSLFAPPEQWLEQNPVGELASAASSQNQGYVRTKHNGAYGVRGNAWQKLAGLKYEHDTMDGSSVQVRVYINDPGKLTKDTMVSGYVKGSEVDRIKATFEKWFVNKLRVIHLDQQGAWGQPVEVAARVDLTRMDTTNLHFYSYDKATNTYRRIEKPAYWIDENGYLHFTTEYAGDIVISDGTLEKK